MTAAVLVHLLTSAIALTVFYPLLAILLRLFRPRAAWTYRIAWGGVLAVPFFALSLPVAVPVAEKIVPAEPVSARIVGTESEMPSFLLPRAQSPQRDDVEEENPAFVLSVSPMVYRNTPERNVAFENRQQIALLFLLALWLGGVAVILGRRLRLHRKLARFLRSQNLYDTVESGAARKIWRSLLREHGISATKIPFLATDSLGPALVRRGQRYSLLIPQTVCEELPDEVLRGILRHELAHYRNRDTFWTLFFRFLAALLWFHPLARKALAHYETAVEWCCDEFAYLRPGEPGSQLLAKTFLVIHQSTESLALNLSTFACLNTLDRVNRLARSETLGKEPLMKKLIFLTLLGMLFLAGTVQVQLVAQNEDASPQNSPVADKKFPLVFESEAELTQFLETYTPPPPSLATPSGRKVIDQNNLKMLALAFHNYSDANRFLPSSSTAEDGTGRPMHSWRVALLPYMEQTELYEKIRRDEPWDSEYNKQFHTQMPDGFRSPYLTDEQSRQGLTSYVAIVGTLRDGQPGMDTSQPAIGVGSSPNPNPLFTRSYIPVGAIFPGPNSWNTFSRITDGTSNTILFAQRRTPVCWMDPTGDVPIKIAIQGIGMVPNGLGIDGSEGINVTFADGSVRFLTNMRPNAMLEAILTCNGGESIALEPERLSTPVDHGVSVDGVVTLDGESLAATVGFFNSNTTKSIVVDVMPDGRLRVPSTVGLLPGDYRLWIHSSANAPRVPAMYKSSQTTPLATRLEVGENMVRLELESNSNHLDFVNELSR